MNNVSLSTFISPCHGISLHIAIGATLTLRDERGQETGSLVVQLLDVTAHATQPAVDGASHDAGQGLPSSPPVLEPVQNPSGLAATIRYSGDGIINLLKQVVEKMELVAKSVSKRAEVSIAPPPQHQLL